MSGREVELVKEVFGSNWIAPLGPQVDAFEREFAGLVGSRHALALSSGTAGLHLALLLCGVGSGNEVLASTLTFAASVNPILYQKGFPTFIDSDRTSWNMDPGLLAETIEKRAKQGRLPKAVILVHLYGQSADIAPILAACDRYGVPLIEDAAEALGAVYTPNAECGMRNAELRIGVSNPKSEIRNPKSGSPGTFGRAGVFSFNGNKIITTSNGGMLVSDDEEFIRHARKLATQAREPFVHYEHTEIGYNYRMSNVLAAIGRGQLSVLSERVEARRRIFDFYRQRLGDLPGIAFMPEAPYSRSTRWLTCLTIDPVEAGTDREKIRLALEAENIESRPVWKPMHLQPVFAKYEIVKRKEGGGRREEAGGSRKEGGTPKYGDGSVSGELFEKGLCLPSGSSLIEPDLERIVGIIRATIGRSRE
jgi:pyridoxal phosphate-dependent aminotransferase EpsN